MAPVVGLYGIGGTYNYGCEAIVRGTAHILRAVLPDVRIIYVSPMPEYDRQMLFDLDLTIMPRTQHPKLSRPRLAAAVFRRTGIPRRYQPYYEDIHWIDLCDMVFSIGGDMYTLSMAYHLAHLAEIVRRKKKKFVIWGGSIGPLPTGDRQVLLRHFRSVDLITSREPETTRFLADHHIVDNVIEVADPAFAVSSGRLGDRYQKGRLLIGVNLSPLVQADIAKGDTKGTLRGQADFIVQLVERYKAEVILVPHVVSDDCVQDDDLRHLQAVFNLLPEVIATAVTVADTTGGYRAAKKILGGCDLVIASRMHCAINAASEGVPVLFVAYSQKAYGMCEYLYGNREWVIASECLLSGKGIGAVASMIDNLGIITKLLKQRMEAIRSDVFPARDRLLQLR
ncbi:colanic acid biosynthesis protein [Geobacter sp. OR-1]|uniref:polysaccharide pyruvyl transferase family protein n=1 Tax=Geobacter sp. OR-1 TaxID=1266765 RepID=UPI0005424A14|nr:polysaccharide pyruvyl transferase family protein [Geobacter sp. OR-1]GAM08217.1 colanic acid biosynthesis protein [Geobacter sp. OR-1]